MREKRGACDIGSNQRMVSLESKMDTVTSQLFLTTSELHNLSIQQATPSPNSQALVAPSCASCGSMMHIISLCPNHHEEVNAMYQGRSNQQQRWDSNTTS